MANLTKRIIDLQTTSTLGSDDYVMVDGATNGTKKYLLKDVLDEIEDIKEGTALGTGAVTTDKLAAGAVTNAKIGDGAVDTTNIADNAVTAAKIDDGAVGTDALAANAVTGAKIATGAVGTGNIASGAVTLDKIASDSNATSSRNGLMSSADKAKLDGFSAASNYALKSDIVGAYIFKGSVNTESDLPSTGLTVGDVYNIIAASSYGESGANVAWTGSSWDALGESFDISDGAIDTEQLANGAVTNGKLAEGAKTTISPATVAYDDPTYGSGTRQGYDAAFGNSGQTIRLPKVSSSLLIDVENIPTIPEKKIGYGAITANKIAAGAVGTEKLANSAVNTDKLATAAVSTDKIASLAVTTNKIAAGAVDNSKLANNAVGTAQIANGAVTSEKLDSDIIDTIDSKAAASDVTALQEHVDEELDEKADVYGYYATMTVGAADNLTGRGDGVSSQYLYRTAGGNEDIADGVATIRSIKGQTLVWNQMYKKSGSSTTVNDVVFTVNADGTITVSGTASGLAYKQLGTNMSITSGHKYLLKGCPLTADAACRLYVSNSQATGNAGENGEGVIFTGIADGMCAMGLTVFDGKTVSNVTFYPQLFDLTQMFGAGNEPTTVAEFEALFPQPYYPYSESTLLSVNMEGIETVGFNQWDEEWESGSIDSNGVPVASSTTLRSKNFIKVFPNTEYFLSVSTTALVYEYDADKNFIRMRLGGSDLSLYRFTTSDNCRYLKFRTANTYGGTYKNDICLNLSWSGYRNGEYEEYWKSQREILLATYFPDGMRSAGIVHGQYPIARDEITPEKAIVRVAKVVLDGSQENMSYMVSTNSNGISTAYPRPADWVAAGFPAVVNRQAVVTCDKLPTMRIIYNNWTGKGISGWGDNSAPIIIAPTGDDSITTSNEFKAWLTKNPLTIYYAMAEPTEVEIDPPLNLSYKVSDFGTEKVMVDEEADAPQSAPPIIQTAYGINATDTVRRLPTQYISHESFQQFVAALQSAVGITVTETWDENDGRYEYTVTQTGE